MARKVKAKKPRYVAVSVEEMRYYLNITKLALNQVKRNPPAARVAAKNLLGLKKRLMKTSKWATLDEPLNAATTHYLAMRFQPD